MFNSASNYADQVDWVMLIIVGISVGLLLLITIAMIYFVFRYNRKKNPVASQIHGNVLLEVIWIVIPTLLVMVMFWYGYDGFQKLRADMDDAYEIKGFAFMWGWNFEYPNGKKTDTLYIPLSKKTKLILTSRDVNHSFYIPAFRLKEDVIGGRNHYIMLTPKTTGSYTVTCAEYCGLNHWNMYTKLHVVEDYVFEKWLSEGMQPKEQPSAVPDTNKINNTEPQEAKPAGNVN